MGLFLPETPLFGQHILGVVFHSTQDEVVRMEASRVVTTVHYDHALWDGAAEKLIRHAVGITMLAV